MKKNIILIFTRILYTLFLIGTIIALFIVYKQIDSGLAFKFLMGYLFLAIFMVLYIPFITIINSRRLKWLELKKRLIKFITLFLLFGSLNYILDWIFRPLNVNLIKNFSVALGLAFGISFIDVTFFKKERDLEE